MRCRRGTQQRGIVATCDKNPNGLDGPERKVGWINGWQMGYNLPINGVLMGL